MKRVAIQGISASFHEEAAFKYFGREINAVGCDSFKATCETLNQGKSEFAVMAIENSIAGSLLPNYTLIRDYAFSIIGEVYLPIQLHLLGIPGARFENAKTVISHPIALRQCGDFLENYPALRIVEGRDTAACAKKVKEEGLADTFAVANLLAAELYGLEVFEKRIESNKKNYTRFLILQNEKNQNPVTVNKASLCFHLRHSPGALARILTIFADSSLNLTKIQSMPILGKRNEYTFYVDVEWAVMEDYESAIKKILKFTCDFNIMGEYVKNEKI